MWFWIAVIPAAILVCELALRLPILDRLVRMRRSADRSMHVLRSARISDHWKEKVLPAYARDMAGASIGFFVLLCLALLPLALVGIVYPGGMAAWGAALVRPMALVVLSVGSIGYIWLRAAALGTASSSSAASGDYSPLDKVLHRLALASPVIAEMTHDIERALYLRSAPEPKGGPVIVSGLARAGTTTLMRELHLTGHFASLTFADMPFVLAPNLWHSLSGRSQSPGVRRERAHGDGIEVDFQSPEALDEVYWRVFAGKDYIRPDGLQPHVPDDDQIAGYRDLMRLVLRRHGAGRYLSKNNNMLLRLGPLAAAMPDARFLVPFRDPLQHAASLLTLHGRFLNSDAFTQDYMTWLGHHEFGATHRPFLFGDRPEGDPQSLDYWLRNWIAVYERLEGVAVAENVLLIPYERLCRDPAVWNSISDRLGIPSRQVEELRPVSPRPVAAHDPELAAKAQAIYARLDRAALGRLRLPG